MSFEQIIDKYFEIDVHSSIGSEQNRIKLQEYRLASLTDAVKCDLLSSAFLYDIFWSEIETYYNWLRI